jgi:hypothetical protein
LFAITDNILAALGRVLRSVFLALGVMLLDETLGETNFDCPVQFVVCPVVRI